MVRVLQLFSVVLASYAFFTAGCAGSRDVSDRVSLSSAQALELAVTLANTECKTTFDAEPFDSSSYAVKFVDGLWHWGEFDLAGFGGFSARVSFDAEGGARQVEVFLSTDSRAMPLRQP